MHSLYHMSDKGLLGNEAPAAVADYESVITASTISDHIKPPRILIGKVDSTTDPVPTSPCLESAECVASCVVETGGIKCCKCLRYCSTIAVSERVSAGIGILDPREKVEPVQLATLLLPHIPPPTPSTHDTHNTHEYWVGGMCGYSSTHDLHHKQPVTRLRSFAATDFLFDSFLSHATTNRTSPMKRAASALASVDETARLQTARQQWLKQQWNRAAQLAVKRPPGLSIFHHPDDRCQCACHCLTAKYVVDELLHSGYTSTVFACKRVTPIHPTIYNRCYGHIVPYSGVSGVSSVSSGVHTPPKQTTADILTVSGCLTNKSVSTHEEEETSSPTHVSPHTDQSSTIESPSDDMVEEGSHHQAVRSACAWLLPIQGCQEVVIKIIHKSRCDRDELDRCIQESKFLSVLHHPNIAKLLASFDGTNELWMFFERATFTDLEEATTGQTFPEATVKCLVSQVLGALHYLHQRRIIHCDVKPKNILLYCHNEDMNNRAKDRKFRGGDWSSIQLRLADFGLAQSVPLERNCIKFDGVRGSHGFFAPEVLLRRDYDFKIDVWAVGIITFMLLVGYEPFYPPSKCIQEEITFESRYWDSISTEARDFVTCLLTFNPQHRASAEDALSHPWLTIPPH
eukprot:Blabericola_migrator_1__11504@NODE_686_length_6875_cov_181_991774_g499_i0_p1_GENE_NODE_686_length_6875_cov_181_991774_g499_i0NODE_686_length_6875_cov_181_991774_g499_i0_p1_ORF_typecomplete_len628_score78_45Pkinase/PF00069_25/5_3e55Pkinase_Tyr/PF07714_17/8_8e32Kinaselike/PF14531_6/0_12Kinaselike/PF14531_6/0_0025Pkinase_fungal/PF17667_1/3_8e07Kdo/PF06293_14/1e05Pox_serthr_kin/PF05445_11/0_0071RIO1/PF01163_22/0_037WaaY/PF06176_11/0_097YrbLPhoP_reg/PF10707_9/4_2e03YrbLPhoP_reg/PF10707_9/0_43_NODE_68